MKPKILKFFLCLLFKSAIAQESPLSSNLKRLIEAGKVATNGFISIQEKESKYYIAIPDSILQRDILVFSRVIEANEKVRRIDLDGSGYPGSKVYEEVIRFVKQGNRIVIKVIPYARHLTSVLRGDMAGVKSLTGTSFDIIWNSKGCNFIDLSAFLFGDHELLFVTNHTKSTMGINQLHLDSLAILYLGYLNSNVDIGTFRLYENGKQLSLNTSLVLLPIKPMVPRKKSQLVGYYTMDTSSQNPLPDGFNKIITKWRIEPKPGDIAKYKSGELVEPLNPIIFYVGKSVPQKWISYYIEGIELWQHAFEKIGFKNAIKGKIWQGTNDSLFRSPYSVAHFLPSRIRDAMYSTIVDPRSGEILQSHILFSSAMIDNMQDEYFKAAAAVDPAIHTDKFSDSVTGLLIKVIIAHEIGHALGLNHNFAASACVPVSKLRDRDWLHLNGGHNPSIMDYSRYNYVAQPEDSVGEVGIHPHVGNFDEIAIKYGYFFSYENWPMIKNQSLEKAIGEELRKLDYIYVDENSNDPRCTSFTVGNDAIESGELGIRNLEFVVNNLVSWTGGSKPDSNEIARRYDLVLDQFKLYIEYVSNFIGGVYETALENGTIKYKAVPYKEQVASLRFLDKHVFCAPQWLFNKKVLDIIGGSKTAFYENINKSALLYFMSGKIINHLTGASNNKNTSNVLKIFNQLHNFIWIELSTNDNISKYRQSLQTTYVNLLIEMIKPKIRWRIAGDKSDPVSRLKFAGAQLNLITQKIDKCLPLLSDSSTISYLSSLKNKITLALSKAK